ncbi:MAG: isoaspartyl peptidase/L-asparaginase [Rickettsiales bacterium]
MKKFFIKNSLNSDLALLIKTKLEFGIPRNDVLEDAIRFIETDKNIDSVGYGGFPNILGEMELDAAFMDGDNRTVGAVAGVKNFLPVRIARKLMEENLHTMLAGEGAEIFAHECGFEGEKTLSPAQRKKWKTEIKPLLSDNSTSLMQKVRQVAKPKIDYDTVVILASDGNGISAATSTSGWPYKYPSRIGDTPIAGAGFYVDSRYGGCLCNYTGEMSIRTGIARLVVAQMEMGKSVNKAVDEAIRNLSQLKTGLLRGLGIYAVDKNGKERSVAINIDIPEVKYWFWCKDMSAPEQRIAEKIEIPSWR